MEIELPSGRLTADQITLQLAKPLADEGGFIGLQRLVAEMKREEHRGTGLFPPDLSADEATRWLRLKSLYSQHALATEVARMTGKGVEVLPSLIDNNMLAEFYGHLSEPELHYLDTLSNYDRFRLYWKMKDIYKNGVFRRHDIEALRQWARQRIPGWP